MHMRNANSKKVYNVKCAYIYIYEYEYEYKIIYNNYIK